MANMLSAQLTAMKLNVLHSKVSGGAIVYAPAVGFTSAGLVTGFITINDLMAQAEAALAASAGNLTVTAGPQRSAEEALKTALDDANNNKNFTQATPCDFAFANPN
jgi:hypothetical protein